jgi:hypothetical protein
MAGKFNLRKPSLLLAGLSIAVFLTANLLIANGQGYYNPNAFNDPHAALYRSDAARAYQTSFEQYYDPYLYIDPQAALDLRTSARANQVLYSYDSSDWEYWANLWLNAPTLAGI